MLVVEHGSDSLVEHADDFKSTCGYVYDPRMMIHEHTFRHHDEQPHRISEIYEMLSKEGCISRMREIQGREVHPEEVMLIHSSEVMDQLESLVSITQEQLEETAQHYERRSLYVCSGTPLASRLSCGGVIEAALAVARGECKKSFAIVRPPGHHAEPYESMGFCFYNNVAIAARVVQDLTPLQKILIVDWDIHHGNGTHRAFNEDPSILYVSLHRYDNGTFYPGGLLGSVAACGEGPGLGYCINVPWPHGGMSDADYLHAFNHVIMPIATEFAPDLVFISAGFDAAEGDRLGACLVSPSGYAHMTHMLCRLANGRVVVALEGGYNLESISKSALAVTKTLLGDDPPQIPPMHASPAGMETVWQVAMEQSKYWKSIALKPLQPRESVLDSTIPAEVLLKSHQEDTYGSKYELYPVSVGEALAARALSSSHFLTDKLVVLYVHESEKIRGELQPLSSNIDPNNSYKIDPAHELVSWIRKCGYGLLDVTLDHEHLKIPQDELSRDVVTYLWDNYLVLSEATQVVLIGQGAGCQPLMNLLAHRESNVIKLVRGIVHLVGLSSIPLTPRDSTKARDWYKENSQVYIPTTHPIFNSGKILKRHGNVIQLEEVDPFKLLRRAISQIQEFVHERLTADNIAI